MEELQRRLAAIMFSDMVGYTALMQENEPKATALRDLCREILRRFVGQHGGQILQFYGDGALSTFPSAIEATRCAIDIQLAQREELDVALRIGIHVGDVVFEKEGIVGDGVNVASRIEGQAAPGGICVSERVYDDIKNQPGMEAKSLGRVELKNVRRPIEIFALTTESLAVPEEVLRVEEGTKQTPTELDPSRLKESHPARSIAVLPFVNMSADPENEYFSDGITEEILNVLTKVGEIQVASRTSAFAFKGKQVDIRKIGDQLGVGTVLEGSVRKAGTKLRITAQLINITDGYHLWSETYDRNLEDVFAIQDEISQAIVDKLRIKLVGKKREELVKCDPCNVEAYNLYLKGRYYWNKWTEEGLKKGIEFFQQAIEKDAKYAPAYAGIADSYTLLRAYGYFSPKDSYPRAKEAAAKALELDEQLAEAHNSMALVRMFYDWDWSGAEREFKRALELNPGFAGAHHSFAVYLTAMGRFDEAIAEIKRAQELDPLSLPINSFVGWVYFHAGHNDQAIGQYRKALDMDPNFPLAHFYLGWVYLRKSMFEEAKSEFKKWISLAGGSWGEMMMRAIVFAFSNRRDEAQKLVDELLALSKQRYVCPQCIAGICTALDQKDQAFEWLEKAYEEHSSDLIFLKVHKGWDSIRSDGRFIALLKKVGLE